MNIKVSIFFFIVIICFIVTDNKDAPSCPILKIYSANWLVSSANHLLELPQDCRLNKNNIPAIIMD
ncbi:MAG: hypothetical protein IJS25_02310 [Bacteroidales bacterium]|nr:hypothetical protein [Bacteroidales bacterium]